MKKENEDRMWDIDEKIQLGQPISEEEKEFFNANYNTILELYECKYEHWKFNTNKI
jgi:hypothetical protein